MAPKKNGNIYIYIKDESMNYDIGTPYHKYLIVFAPDHKNCLTTHLFKLLKLLEFFSLLKTLVEVVKVSSGFRSRFSFATQSCKKRKISPFFNSYKYFGTVG